MTRKVLITGSIIVALVLAVGVGVVAYAQGGTPSAPTTAADTFWNSLAQRLGVTADALKQAVRDAAKDTVAQALQSGQVTQPQADKLNRQIDQWQGRLPFGLPHLGAQMKARIHLTQVGIAAAAQALGMTEAELRAALVSGQTLRQLATAKGVDPATVETAIADAEKAEIDKAAAAGKLTAEQATQGKARVDQAVANAMDHTFLGLLKPGGGLLKPDGGLLPGRPGLRGVPRFDGRFAFPEKAFGVLKRGVAEAAQALGMTESELLTELRAGQTIRQVAVAEGVDPAVVEKAIADAGKAEIDQAQAAGKLTGEEATRLKGLVEAAAKALMDRVFVRLPGDGRPRLPATPAPTLTPDASA